MRLIQLFLLVVAVAALAATDPYEGYDAATGDSIYVSTTGNDSTGTGAIGSPYATLGRALADAGSGDEVVMRGGSYADVTETTTRSRSGWVTVRNYTGETPIISSISLDLASPAAFWLRFDGITFQDSSGDPLVFVDSCNNVEFRNCIVRGSGTKYDVASSMSFYSCSNILVWGTEVENLQSGLLSMYSWDVKFVKNHIHNLGGGSTIRIVSYEALVERNHMHDSHFNADDPGFPGDTYSPHGSGVSIRCSNLTIRGNEIHDCGSSSGVMTYGVDAAGGTNSYNNITIENNLFYDLLATAIRSYNLGTNVLVRNNTVVGRLREPQSTTGAYNLNGSLQIHTYAEPHSLTLDNNVFLGYVYVPTNTVIRNNFFWSGWWNESAFSWWSTAPGTASVLATTGAATPWSTITNGYFNGVTGTNVFASGYAAEVDYTLASGSPGINAGDASLDTSVGMGSISGGFIQYDGNVRDASHHSWGAFEVAGGGGGDTTAPTISSLSDDPSTTSAIVTWSTDELSSSGLEWGLTASYGSSSTNSSLVTSHSLSATSLSAGTLYHYRVLSSDAAGNTSASSDGTFTTTSESPGGGTVNAATVNVGTINKVQ